MDATARVKTTCRSKKNAKGGMINFSRQKTLIVR